MESPALVTLAAHPTTAPPLATYGAVLGSRHVVRLLGGTLIGRLPNSMVPVGLVLWITGGGGSLSFAGMLAALYGLASGLSQPVKGRLMDRYGQTRVSTPAVLLNAGSLASLPLIRACGHPAAVTAVVGLAGLVTPPLEAGLRALWPTVLPDLGRRRVVQALDTGSQGLLYIAGPLLASWLATTHGPDTALAATAALGLVGTTVVLTAAPSQTWRPAAGVTERGRLMSAGLVLLFTALAGTGFAFGAMNVWAAGMAGTHGQAMLCGLLPAVFSTGSFLGSLIYARRAWPGTTKSQLITTSALFLLGWIPLLAQPGPRTAFALMAIPGLFFTLIITNGFHTVDSLASASRTTEGYSWLILSVGTGQAAGTALTAALAAHPDVLAALPAGGAATALTVLVLARRKLGPGRRLGRHRRPRQQVPRLVAFEGIGVAAGGSGSTTRRTGCGTGRTASADAPLNAVVAPQASASPGVEKGGRTTAPTSAAPSDPPPVGTAPNGDVRGLDRRRAADRLRARLRAGGEGGVEVDGGDLLVAHQRVRQTPVEAGPRAQPQHSYTGRAWSWAGGGEAGQDEHPGHHGGHGG
ncbi:MFS transporter [Streptomyces nojiriensis]|nr:MFS transporter [Streptomyces nojiriensis]